MYRKKTVILQNDTKLIALKGCKAKLWNHDVENPLVIVLLMRRVWIPRTSRVDTGIKPNKFTSNL